MPISRSVLALLSLVAVWSTLVPGTVAGQKPFKRERNVIGREELLQAAEKFPELYQAIKSLRPHFLTVNNRGMRSTGVGEGTAVGSTGRSIGAGGSRNLDVLPVVYLDGGKSGEPDFLKGILTKNVAEVRYLSPNEAGNEYGLGHEGGAIVVTMFKEKTP